MIASISGQIKHKGLNYLVVEVGGVGYKVFVPTEVVLGSAEGRSVELWTHLAVRENVHDLFGFTDREGLDLFELLITLSGIGPKTALGIMNVTTPTMLRQAVAENDSSYLTKVSGIGKKTAEKIVRELEGKLAAKGEKTGDLQVESDVLEALVSLGYNEREIRNILKEIPKDVQGTNDRVKYALKHLSNA